jgi:hypothetical protein
MPKYHVLDLLGRQPQPAAQNFEQDQAKIRPVFEHWQKIPAVQQEGNAISTSESGSHPTLRWARRLRPPTAAVSTAAADD